MMDSGPSAVERFTVPNAPLPENVLDQLRKPNPAVMGTVNAEGRPVTVATWYLIEPDGTLLLGLDATRARLKHLGIGAPVSLTALGGDDWYMHVSVQGHVTSVVPDEGLREIDRLSTHYTGKPYANRTSPRVAVRVEIDRWHGWKNSTAITD